MLGIGYWFARGNAASSAAKVPVPVFAFFFLALCLLNSVIPMLGLSAIYAPVKAVLLMQERFPGIGNWMADEVLWRAAIHPRRAAGTLKRLVLQGAHDLALGFQRHVAHFIQQQRAAMRALQHARPARLRQSLKSPATTSGAPLGTWSSMKAASRCTCRTRLPWIRPR